MKKGLLALSPLAVFILLYLVTSIVAGDFYKVPITVAFMVASIYAVMISSGMPLRKRIDAYSRGASTDQMVLMIWIFVLAGAFAHSAKVMGAIDETVNLTLSLLPPQMLLAGLFLAACGCHIVLFTTGRGTPFGTFVPTMKIATNPTLAKNKPQWVDFSAGQLVQGRTMKELVPEFIDKVLTVASGERARNEENDYREISIFKNGVTL